MDGVKVTGDGGSSMSVSPGGPAATLPYEARLDRDPRWALLEGSLFFEGKGAVFEALHKVARRLDGLAIPYAVVGGMALFQHGLRRFTEDVDILVTRDGLKIIHEKLEGLGYLPPHKHSKHLRDTELGVRIEFLIAGAYPGDGKPKPVAFPDPGSTAVESGGVRYIDLETLVELKLASGMSNPGRLKDLADVHGDSSSGLDVLPPAFAERLAPLRAGPVPGALVSGQEAVCDAMAQQVARVSAKTSTSWSSPSDARRARRGHGREGEVYAGRRRWCRGRSRPSRDDRSGGRSQQYGPRSRSPDFWDEAGDGEPEGADGGDVVAE